MWLVSSSSEYDEWFSSLDEQSKEAVLVKVYLLQEFGPQLGRPYVDTLKGTENKRNRRKMKNAIKAMEANMSEESVRRARIKAEQEIFAMRLYLLREEQGVKQSEMKNFNQASVSKIEKRKDIKLSTLLDYLDSLDLNLEIAVYPRDDYSADSRRVLLRV